jgi:hypothetical protein
MAAMRHATDANKLAVSVTSMNANLRTGMDLILRDLMQTGQDLPVGRVIAIPSGANSQQVRFPGPPNTAFLLPVGTTQVSAVTPNPGKGPTIQGVATDMITVLAADSSFSNMDLTAITNNSMTVALPGAGVNGLDISTNGPADILPGQLIMLTKGSTSTLVEVTTVNGVQTANFASNDSLRLNQTTAAAGTLTALNAVAPVTNAAQTQATRIRMISYYIDAVATPSRPRLIRRMANGDPLTYNNLLGTAVAFDVDNLQVSYDINNGASNPANVKMVAKDLTTAGKCAPSACSANQIRKINVVLSTRSGERLTSTQQFLHNTLTSQVSLRSLAFVDKYTNVP